MIIDIDLTGATAVVALAEPEDCKGFHVAVRGGDDAALGAALRSEGAGRLLGTGDALIEIAAVQRLAEGRVDPGWSDDFAAMLKYAESKGWLDDTGTAIQAHIERAG